MCRGGLNATEMGMGKTMEMIMLHLADKQSIAAKPVEAPLTLPSGQRLRDSPGARAVISLGRSCSNGARRFTSARPR